jgi:hypothetical protein
MRGVWLVVAVGLVASVGCTSTPKRELRQPIKEELVGPGPGEYTNPPDYTRDQPLLTPKQSATGLNSMPGLGGPAGQGGPGAPGAGMAPGGMRR